MNLQYQLNRFLPFLRWGRGMTRSSMRADAIAGLTGAAIVLPQGVAFAAIAGMPPEYGLYTSMVPAVIAALFGSSWHLVSGPTTAASVIMFASLSGIATPGSEEYVALAITLAFMVGVLQLIMGVVRLGALVNFISHSVVVGFTAGAACLIAAKQAEEFLGIDIPDGAHLLATLDFLWQNWRDLHPLVTLVALITLLSGILAQRRLGGMSMIAAMVAGSIAAALFNLAFSEETSGIHMVGALPQQLPPLSMPQFSLDVFRQLSPLALAMTLFALTEAVSIARSISLKSGQPIEGNQEFIGQGLSNILGSFFSSYVATGSFNRSGANYDAGARTPMAAALAGVLLVVLVLLVAPLTSYLASDQFQPDKENSARRSKRSRDSRNRVFRYRLLFDRIRDSGRRHPVADDFPAQDVAPEAVAASPRPGLENPKIHLRSFPAGVPAAEDTATRRLALFRFGSSCRRTVASLPRALSRAKASATADQGHRPG
jgi:SulP family sulfate permease